jgi:hypothetical protein
MSAFPFRIMSVLAPMQFRDHMFEIPSRGGNVRVRVTADAFQCLWGQGSGPQNEVGLIEANMPVWEEIAADKLEAGADASAVIVISSLDLED